MMSQIKDNKSELLKTMERLAHEPLSPYNIGALHEMMGAYNAMCLVERMEHSEEREHHEEPARTNQKSIQTA